MQVPNTATGLLYEVYNTLFPIVEEEMKGWEEKAAAIPDKELQLQALASIDSKKFHCQGGAVFALLAGMKYEKAIRFIVAYQTISDYLDNLCDRSTSLDPKDFRMLHEAMKDALRPEAALQDYYAYRSEKADGGYLEKLVLTCQAALKDIDDYEQIQEYCLELWTLYADLQVHKHVKVEERIPRLTTWYKEKKDKALGLSWYEFAAASGSTLGIFCLVSYAMGGKMTASLPQHIMYSYFPSVQGLHILLDYYIDQKEDEMEGDLNFCNYYRDDVELLERLQYFIHLAEDRTRDLPDSTFHQFIPKGLVALYLSDEKVESLREGKQVRKRLLKTAGMSGAFLHYNIRLYNKVKLHSVGSSFPPTEC